MPDFVISTLQRKHYLVQLNTQFYVLVLSAVGLHDFFFVMITNWILQCKLVISSLNVISKLWNLNYKVSLFASKVLYVAKSWFPNRLR